MLKNPGITVFVSYPLRCVSIIHFDQRSRPKTPTAIRNATMRRDRSGIFLAVPDRAGASRTDCREFGGRTDVISVLPAALALRTRCPIDRDAHALGRMVAQLDLGNDKESRQLLRIFGQQRVELAVGRKLHAGFERRADDFFLPRSLKALLDLF